MSAALKGWQAVAADLSGYGLAKEAAVSKTDPAVRELYDSVSLAQHSEAFEGSLLGR